MERDEKEQAGAGTGEEHRKARGRSREDHLAAGRQLAADENLARANTASARPDASPGAGEYQSPPRPAVDNNDVSELSENDSSGG
jgi:hypothetical protein